MASQPAKKFKMDLTYCEYNASTMLDSKGGFLVQEAEDEAPSLPEVFPTHDQRCQTCGSIDLNFTYQQHFDINVCINCVDKMPEAYSLLTKTESKEDYLLTESELKDLKFWIKPNPHKSTYSNMLLYCRKQVEAFAFKKWGSEQGLDAEFAVRRQKKEELANKRRKKKLKELRTKTRPSLVNELRASADHQHEFGEAISKGGGYFIQVCKECKMEVGFEEM
jgi:DNA-repair protein complementing XP-A cells